MSAALSLRSGGGRASLSVKPLESTNAVLHVMSDSTACTPFSDPRPCARLVVSADDFGISPRINEGIVRAHREGIVTSTSLMAVGRAFEHAVQCCRDTPTLDIGVHLTLIAEQPLLTSRSSLTGNDGRFPESAGAFLRRWLTGSIRQADVQAEWSAQIERILAQGIRVTHLDSHQHVHCLPGLADLSQCLAKRYQHPFRTGAGGRSAEGAMVKPARHQAPVRWLRPWGAAGCWRA